MKLEFNDVINKHKNVPCLIVGHGPSANPYIENMAVYNSLVLISCNDWFNFYTRSPDYWVISNNVFTIRKNQNIINKNKKTVLVYADSVDLTSRKWVTEHISTDYLPYDQRHFNSQKCGCGDCCNHIINGRLTIQEELKKYSSAKTLCTHSDTVAVNMISLGILLGCNPIYICGFDMNYAGGYAKNSKNIGTRNTFTFENERINETFIWMNDCANNVGSKIIELNSDSPFDFLQKGTITI